MKRTHFSLALIHPRYWFFWLIALLWMLLAQLPYRWQMRLARVVAPLLLRNKKRIGYARKNIAECFPTLSAQEREVLLKKNAESMAMAIFETGIGWFWSSRRLNKIHSIQGEEYLRQAEQEGAGVLLLTMHFSTLDIGSAFLGCHTEFDGLYRPHSNAMYDYLQRKGRESYCETGLAIPRDSVRTMIARLRKGRFVWYAPDRDLGPKNSVFVDFFGVPTAMVTATSKIVTLGKARVVPFTQYRRADGSGYELVIHPAFDNFPSGDDVADTQRIADFMQSEIKKYPEQYFWAQPRFKTRPQGEPEFYE
ncbi:LpxL/LpxP family Kdo(2)-lipid IV(A) lauroyl/palmitoleoyl acyltransferase [Gilvimarinus agarilyticus]|uniref:LpxL/LpxP family Kdo(2)-lipid IV(A) lauroyl/palmitoleoyl acyltransferase n=1 Tax=unclassified Gilvimarinus TaxID=2642066 RepID=UPI001C09A325|nr:MULTISPECIES: LpxL/LpxP family Kdo(2)-lipid IV(A) lauroyl/palmitoleoyl acyltransferase [unclassified Gilvimarinus]MBU2885933.1 LpxL/LpxP family Kdo(2)-lipid IV(A) lauroyl/palmitoleoyl acyltransferase [Gilvimarinus agarilyticus]MDO6570679.1 LpxL/LpxP family Kdo(2)-lipid IV(A) lauroyl/palmitoleoyl acyltransferase [Gilvimarinus sp. 2_MG-2023]MDO6747728.1 LpxL/LpxP family Kdo(2)-lipid IV(A) lauroyl/palmitoleoyl acyltransferase [Gilvimarinus sp. 1_MG-2023]